jgi:hypothetical protein
VYLVTGNVAAAADGLRAHAGVHDVVYTRLLHEGRYASAAGDGPDFRMAVHALSDEVVQSDPECAGQRGHADRDDAAEPVSGSYDLLIVDSDGFGMRRIAGFGGQLYSPAWSPDARRVLYASTPRRAGTWSSATSRRAASGRAPGRRDGLHARLRTGRPQDRARHLAQQRCGSGLLRHRSSAG